MEVPAAMKKNPQKTKQHTNVTTTCSSLTPAGWSKRLAHICAMEIGHDFHLSPCFVSQFSFLFFNQRQYKVGGERRESSSGAVLLGNSAGHWRRALKTLRMLFHHVDEIPMEWGFICQVEQNNPRNYSWCVPSESSFAAQPIHSLFCCMSSKERGPLWPMQCLVFRWQCETCDEVNTATLLIWLTINSLDKQ